MRATCVVLAEANTSSLFIEYLFQQHEFLGCKAGKRERGGDETVEDCSPDSGKDSATSLQGAPITDDGECAGDGYAMPCILGLSVTWLISGSGEERWCQ